MEEYISKGFLYTLWNDHLTVKEGNVVRNQWCSNREAIFCYGNRDGDWTRCHPEPGNIVCAKFWLPERNDELGRGLFLEYHKTCIRQLEMKIAAHNAKINLLQDA